MSKTLKIAITGPHGAGKSTIAVVISEALKAAGFKNVNLSPDPDFETPKQLEDIINSNMDERINALKSIDIDIQQIQTEHSSGFAYIKK